MQGAVSPEWQGGRIVKRKYRHVASRGRGVGQTGRQCWHHTYINRHLLSVWSCLTTNTRETQNLPSTFRHRTVPRARGVSGLFLYLLVASAQSFPSLGFQKLRPCVPGTGGSLDFDACSPTVSGPGPVSASLLTSSARPPLLFRHLGRGPPVLRLPVAIALWP